MLRPDKFLPLVLERTRVALGRLPMALALTGGVLAWVGAASATELVLPERGSVVGQIQYARAEASDTLLDIARRHNLGYEEIKLANPGVDPWLPGAGQEVLLPTLFVLPDTPRRGVVLNLAEMRIYYYPRPRRGQPATVITHPVSIGRYDWETPLGRTRVKSKVKDPAWYPPRSVREEHAADGDPLPRVVPAGPDNPLGRHALLLGIKGYLIHGTNKPFGIGMRVSHGCIRMYPEDIEGLYKHVPVGTPVHIVDEAIKVGRTMDGYLFVEAHPRGAIKDAERDIRASIEDIGPLLTAAAAESTGLLDLAVAEHVLESLSGIPVLVTMPDTSTPLPAQTDGQHGSAAGPTAAPVVMSRSDSGPSSASPTGPAQTERARTGQRQTRQVRRYAVSGNVRQKYIMSLPQDRGAQLR